MRDMPLSCRVFGHRWSFTARDEEMTWSCARCGELGGRKRYPTAADARRYATAFDTEHERGERRFMLGAAPLWVWRRWRRR